MPIGDFFGGFAKGYSGSLEQIDQSQARRDQTALRQQQADMAKRKQQLEFEGEARKRLEGLNQIANPKVRGIAVDAFEQWVQFNTGQQLGPLMGKVLRQPELLDEMLTQSQVNGTTMGQLFQMGQNPGTALEGLLALDAGQRQKRLQTYASQPYGDGGTATADTGGTSPGTASTGFATGAAPIIPGLEEAQGQGLKTPGGQTLAMPFGVPAAPAPAPTPVQLPAPAAPASQIKAPTAPLEAAAQRVEQELAQFNTAIAKSIQAGAAPAQVAGLQAARQDAIKRLDTLRAMPALKAAEEQGKRIPLEVAQAAQLPVTTTEGQLSGMPGGPTAPAPQVAPAGQVAPTAQPRPAPGAPGSLIPPTKAQEAQAHSRAQYTEQEAAKRLGVIQELGSKADKLVTQYQILSRLSLGPTGPFYSAARELAGKMLPNSNTLSQFQVLDSITIDMATVRLGLVGGSDTEREFLMQAKVVPNKEDTPDARRFKITYGTRWHQREQEQRDEADKWMSKYGSLTATNERGNNYATEWNYYMRLHPVYAQVAREYGIKPEEAKKGHLDRPKSKTGGQIWQGGVGPQTGD